MKIKITRRDFLWMSGCHFQPANPLRIPISNCFSSCSCVGGPCLSIFGGIRRRVIDDVSKGQVVACQVARKRESETNNFSTLRPRAPFFTCKQVGRWTLKQMDQKDNERVAITTLIKYPLNDEEMSE